MSLRKREIFAVAFRVQLRCRPSSEFAGAISDIVRNYLGSRLEAISQPSDWRVEPARRDGVVDGLPKLWSPPRLQPFAILRDDVSCLFSSRSLSAHPFSHSCHNYSDQTLGAMGSSRYL